MKDEEKREAESVVLVESVKVKKSGGKNSCMGRSRGLIYGKPSSD